MTDIKKIAITNHAELMFRIMQLNSVKEEQEEKIKRDIKELYFSMHPAELLKKMAGNFSGNKELQQDATTVGLKTVADFLLGKLLGRNTLKGYFISVLVENIASNFITKNADSIFAGISKLGKLFKSNGKVHENVN